ncbi:hypothetical protein AVL61_02775 [Kocuria rosea subsp. polaris]|uniref:Uncharacterized protein n=1 Tax=Kocuria rosea subsp. polaris TaxID=136273 RepID=A0A0W8IQH2_KOCRO|nr:Rv3654c family TadE-like protein [Kocuria polaris]KUG62022.1 hypothetical protein AVL61_02775 [Kocuria polaris]
MSESPVPRGPQGRRRGRDRDGDLGSGTVHALTLALVLGVLLLTVLLLAQAGIATHRAGKAADLAALAAADTARGLVAGDPCGTAERVARENGARLERCELLEPERVVVDVRTTVALDGPLARIGSARGVSRAGPPEATGAP